MSEKQVCLCATGKCRYDSIPQCISAPITESPQPTTVEDWKNLHWCNEMFVRKRLQENKCPLVKEYKEDWVRIYMFEWRLLNKKPNLTLREAYNQALARISELEAALAEKGGER